MSIRGIVARRLAVTDVLAGLSLLERQAAMAVLMRGPMTRWAEGTSGPLHTGSAGLSIVKSGHVEVVATTEDGRDLVLAEAGDGEVLTCPPAGLAAGEVVMRALADSWVCPLDHGHLRDLAAHPSVLMGLLEQTVRRAEEAQAAALRLAHRRVEDRVLLALRALAARDGRVTGDGVRIAPVLHRDLARVASVTRPGATQALARLERDGRLRRDEDGSILLLGESVPPASCRRASTVPPALARVLRS
jgi:CRP-like cAMP-binding protein